MVEQNDIQISDLVSGYCILLLLAFNKKMILFDNMSNYLTGGYKDGISGPLQ